MKKFALIPFAVFIWGFISANAEAHVVVYPHEVGLQEGNTVQISDNSDPDVFIVNEHGYKRLLLSPQIFSLYGHLRYDGIRRVGRSILDMFPTSALVRNCERGDPKIYVLEVTAEDVASLHWMNVSADAALAYSNDFFQKVFCINEREFALYHSGDVYASTDRIPSYARITLPSTSPGAISPVLTLPEGYRIFLFTPQAVGPLRFMAFSPDNILFASMPASNGLYARDRKEDGKIFAFPDSDRNGVADETKTVLSGMHIPHGIAFHNNYLYVAEETRVLRYPYLGNARVGAQELVIAGLPGGGEGHVSRTIGFSPEGKMYISVGSSCNLCEETDEKRAAIMEYNADGSSGRVFASGLRNSVGLAFHPFSGEIWATENGRDYLGDNLPPDEINIVRDGNNYGWPYCYGKNVTDPEFNRASFCTTASGSTFDIQAHSATLGLRFIEGAQFPRDWQGDLLVAYHGSWNRTEYTGYKVARLDVEGNSITGEYNLISGWLLPDDSRVGRPVDVIFDPLDGALYISDDKANVIYRVVKNDG